MAKGIPPAVSRMARENYAAGYGQGMVDVANKILDEGWDAGVKWVIDNCPDPDLSRRLADSLNRH